MAGDFDEVLGGVGVGGFEIGDDYPIDIRLEGGEVGAAILKTGAIENRVGDVAGLITG